MMMIFSTTLGVTWINIIETDPCMPELKEAEALKWYLVLIACKWLKKMKRGQMKNNLKDQLNTKGNKTLILSENVIFFFVFF